MRLNTFLSMGLLVLSCGNTLAQPPSGPQHILGQPSPRLPAIVLDILPPESRVSGSPGTFLLENHNCRATDPALLRRRIVDVASQEWAYFGFLVEDLRGTSPSAAGSRPRRRFADLDPDEVFKVAATIAGYWSAVPNSDWLMARQNAVWREPEGLQKRWRDPWSAAFISWVMCESGITDQQQFVRAIAHHSYIDQAIKARDGQAPQALYKAYDPGEAEVIPGDMLCSGLRPAYRNLSQRRQQLGEGARTHCDIVVEINANEGTILTIGGNVRSSVRLKIFPAAKSAELDAYLAPLPTNRYIFAHLKLQTPGITAQALQLSPTITGLVCMAPSARTVITDSASGSVGVC